MHTQLSNNIVSIPTSTLPTPTLPEIQWCPSELPSALTTTRKVLRDQDLVFVFSGQLVELVNKIPVTARDMVSFNSDQLVIKQIKECRLGELLLQMMKFVNKKGDYVAAPPALIKSLINNPDFAKPLTGLLETPTITPAGVNMTRSGYNEVTGLYCQFDNAMVKDLCTTATLEDGVDAAKALWAHLFFDFPFKDGLNQDAAIAMLLTAFQRKFMANAPGFMITATTQASGKSTLADVCFRIAYGKPAAAANWTTNQDEMGKYLLSILKEGHSGICFDNLPHGSLLDGDQLAKVLTEELYQGRVLGSNKTCTTTTDALVVLTGNQLRAVNDMRSRLVPIHLEPQMDNPEARKFLHDDITSWVKEYRHRLIFQVHQILLAWHCEGKDHPATLQSSRFPDWDNTVRQQMVWLGLNDPIELLHQNEDSDPEMDAQKEFFLAMNTQFDGKAVTSQQILGEHMVGFDTDLQDSLVELFDGSMPNARDLGKKLSSLKGVVRGGLILKQQEKSELSKKSAKWLVQPVRGE